MIERPMSLVERLDATHLVTGPSDPALRRARVCYDHLAGEIAVRFFDRAIEHGLGTGTISAPGEALGRGMKLM